MSANLQPTDVRPTGSKLDLIRATVAAISSHGLSELTSAKIATAAGHTAASINFHFGSKEALLLATLREVSEEFADVMASVLAEAGDDALHGPARDRRCEPQPPPERIAEGRGVVRVPRRVQRARGLPAHLRRARQVVYCDTVTALCKRLIAARGVESAGRMRMPSRSGSRASSTSSGRAFCSRATNSIAMRPSASAARICAACSRGLPSASRPVRRRRRKRGAPKPEVAADPSLRYTLPAWIYHNEEFHELEKETALPAVVADRVPRERAGEDGRLRHVRILRPAGFVVRDDERHAARVPQRLLASRPCRRRRRARPVREVSHLHVSRLDLSPRRPQPQRQCAGHVSEVRPLEVRPEADRARGVLGIRVRPLPRGRGRASPSACSRTWRSSRTTASKRWCRSMTSGCTTSRSTGRTSSRTTSRTITFRWAIPGLSALMESKYDREVYPGGTMRLCTGCARSRSRTGARSATPNSCRRWSICPKTCAAAGRTSGCSPTSTSTSIPSGWISSSSCRSGRDARAFGRAPMASRTTVAR